MAYAIDGESVVVSSSALPTGAATAAKQLPDGHNVVVTASALPTGAATAAKQLPDGHNVVVTASALPTGAATSALQTSGAQKTQVVDGAGNVATLVNPSEPAATAAWAEKGIRVLIGPTDRISNIPVVQLYDHHQLHEGEIFRWSYVNTAGLASGSSEDMVFTVPNITIGAGFNAVTLCPHLRWEAISDSPAQVFFYEAPTVTAATGTARTPIAMERNGTYTPKMTILEKPTVTVVGTLLWQGIFFNASKAGSTDESDTEFVLKNNTKYLFRFTSGTNACKFLLRFIWYEDLGV